MITMSAKNKGEGAEEGPKDAKGAAELFLQTLGLTDIVLGALSLYIVRLWYGPESANLFPTTGNNWIDLGLLACAAALAGKTISLVVSFLAAVVEGLIEWLDIQNASTTLTQTLTEYRKRKGHTSDIGTWEKVDLAVAYVAKASPGLQRELERIRTTTIMGYSATILAIPFCAYLVYYRVGTGLVVIVAVCILVLILMALIHQVDYLVTLRNSLAVLLPEETSEPCIITLKLE
jgi:hypothetical protein